MKALLVALGAGLGAPARYLLDQMIPKAKGIPWATLLVNTLGSFILGWIILRGTSWSLLLGTGFAGAFTTWSTFAMETHNLLADRKLFSAFFNISATLILGIGAAVMARSLAS